NQQLYGSQINPGGFGWAGNDAAQQGIQNVADVATRNATAEFSQLKTALANHAIVKSDAQLSAMAEIPPELSPNSTNEREQLPNPAKGNSNVIFSLADAQTVET